MGNRPTRRPPPEPPEVTISESGAATLADLAEVTKRLPGDPAASALIYDRLSEELAELAAMCRALPGRPVEMAGRDFQMLGAIRSEHRAGGDVAALIARSVARLAHELGGSAAVLANRPGSWESTHLRALLAGEIGTDDQYLHMYAVNRP
jgi:hypothetical protein